MVGFTTDIGAHPDDLNLAVSLFFVTFVTLQPLSAAIGRYVGAKRWIPIIMVLDLTLVLVTVDWITNLCQRPVGVS